jgi:hypothetical protein
MKYQPNSSIKMNTLVYRKYSLYCNKKTLEISRQHLKNPLVVLASADKFSLPATTHNWHL